MLMNLNELKNDTTRKKTIRETLAEVLTAALIAKYGEENVVFIPCAIEPCGASKIDGGSIAVRVGSVTDKDGYLVDAVAIISVSVKSWNTTITKSNRTIQAINLDDIIEAVEIETAVKEKRKGKKGE